MTYLMNETLCWTLLYSAKFNLHYLTSLTQQVEDVVHDQPALYKRESEENSSEGQADQYHHFTKFTNQNLSLSMIYFFNFPFHLLKLNLVLWFYFHLFKLWLLLILSLSISLVLSDEGYTINRNITNSCLVWQEYPWCLFSYPTKPNLSKISHSTTLYGSQFYMAWHFSI